MTRPVKLERADLAKAAEFLAADLNGAADRYWSCWDEEADGPDLERAAIVRVVEACRVVLEGGGALEVEAGEVFRVPEVERDNNEEVE